MKLQEWNQCRHQYTSILQNFGHLSTAKSMEKCWTCEGSSMYKRTVASEAVKAADSSSIKKHLAGRRSCHSWVSTVHSCLNASCFQRDLRVSHWPSMLNENGKYRLIFFRVAGRISVQTNSLNLDICEECTSKGLLNRLGCPYFTN